MRLPSANPNWLPIGDASRDGHRRAKRRSLQHEIERFRVNSTAHEGGDARSKTNLPLPDARPPTPSPKPHHQACAYGKDALVRDLLAASPPAASTPDGDGYSPLQWAALNGRVSTVALLVSAGADVA